MELIDGIRRIAGREWVVRSAGFLCVLSALINASIGASVALGVLLIPVVRNRTFSEEVLDGWWWYVHWSPFLFVFGLCMALLCDAWRRRCMGGLLLGVAPWPLIMLAELIRAYLQANR